MSTNRFEIFSTAVLRLVKAVQGIKTQKMAEYDLKGTGAVCLCRIYESAEGLTAAELALVCEVDKAQISRTMAELTSRGFVLRTGAGRYKQKYQLTPSGREIAADVLKTMREIEAAVSRDISERELDGFYGTLYRLCDNFDRLLQKHS
ncbi:MAG: hypothetical protein IJC99_04370 [Clostridia bacterium]|nr:hypothetical protein [Clostridia bacterium]